MGGSLIQPSSSPNRTRLTAELVQQSQSGILNGSEQSISSLEPATSQITAREEKDVVAPSVLSGSSNKHLGITKYLSAQTLTVQPYSLEEIELDPPEGFPSQHAGKIYVGLWISETGVVDLVKIDAVFLLPKHREHIQRQFARAHFHPGELNANAVPSFVEIEVLIRPEIVETFKPAPLVRETIPLPSSGIPPRE